MIFQEPMTSLNPLLPVGFQVAEVLEEHLGLGRRDGARARRRAVPATSASRIPEQRVRDYPHQLSGGMRQRVMIAMAMACRPRLLVGDEPTTALDVTIQAQILALLRDLGRAAGTAVLLISHDLGVVATMAEPGRRHVRGAGRRGGAGADALPRAAPPVHAAPPGGGARASGRSGRGCRRSRAASRPPRRLPVGCRFHPRCPDAIPLCREAAPTLEPHGPDRRVRCWRAGELN